MNEKISQQTIDQVKGYSGIVDYIQQYVSLTKRGQNYIGLCPFHSEKTPSFTVSPNKKIFHCFGCHESGDLISFAEKIDSLTFFEAIESIAAFAGISVIKQEQSIQTVRQNKELELILKVLKAASEYFVQDLKKTNFVLDYLNTRSISSDSQEKFLLGYCADSQALISYLKSQSFSQDIMLKSGILYNSNGRLVCRFYKRLIFPICDHQNRVVGFGARNLDPNSTMAKYVNSDESYVFNKRKLLFGLSFAKSSIKKNGFVILVEGYIDVISMVQHGIYNVVACMGTSLTAQQVSLLRRFTDSVVLMFDNDAAGVNAMNKSIDILTEGRMNVSVVNLLDYDPADYLVKNGRDSLIEKINSKMTAFDFFYQRLQQELDLTQIENVSKAINLIVPKLSLIKDDIIRNHYITVVCKNLNLKEEVLVAKINHFLYNRGNYSQTRSIDIKKSSSKLQKAEEIILAIISGNLKFRDIIRGNYLEYFTSTITKDLVPTICNSSAVNSDLLEIIPVDIKTDFSKIVMNNHYSIDQSNEAHMFTECLSVLKKEKFDKDVTELKDKIAHAEKSGEDNELINLLKQLNQLKKGGIDGY